MLPQMMILAISVPLLLYALPYVASCFDSELGRKTVRKARRKTYFEAGNAHVSSRFDNSRDQFFEDEDPFVPYNSSIYEPYVQDPTASRSHGVRYRVEKDVTVKETQILTESDSPPNTCAAASSESRPKATEVQQPPIMSWSSKERTQFLRKTSGRLKLKDPKNGRILAALKRTSKTVFGDGCDQWDEKMDPEFIKVICRCRKRQGSERGLPRRCGGKCYNFKSVRDLVDAFRNTEAHYMELPQNIKNLVGRDPYAYFYSKFPKLFSEVYKVMLNFCKNEDWFEEYRTGCI